MGLVETLYICLLVEHRKLKDTPTFINDRVFFSFFQKTYDHLTRVSQLKMTWIAKSNAEQRAGRAGRCRNGYCFRLFTREDYTRMNATQVGLFSKS